MSTKAKVIKKPYSETKPKKIPLSLMRSLVEIYYDFQKQRIITSNRIFGNVRCNDISDKELEYHGVKDLLNDAESFENRIKSLLTKQLPNFPIYKEYLAKITGIGPIISAGLIAYIDDVSKFENISKLWQLSGYGMNRYCPNCKAPTYVTVEYENREKKKTKAKKLKPFELCPVCDHATVPMIQRRVIGYQSNWNDKMKVLCWKIGGSFVKQPAAKSGYRKIYDLVKADELSKHPTKEVKNGKTFFNKGHLDNRAKRKVVKTFLSHLWTRWREMEGLPVTEAYAGQLLGHSMVNPFVDKED
ncbi:MAG: hypothetical protein GTO02_13450 [Candidatus Dadabacteria bacterium]|nr:hypothetical protein [Candidatus Dadabacteria bacterium]